MSDNPTGVTDIRRIHNMLRRMARMAEHASLTGSLGDGARSAVRQYNALLRYLQEQTYLPTGFFEPLPEDAGFDELGVASTLLAGYVEEDAEEAGKPAPRQVKIALGVNKEQGGQHEVAVELGDLGQLKDLESLSNLKDLGQWIREHLPEWIKEREAGRAAPAPASTETTGENR